MALPQTYRKVMVTTLTTNFRKAIEFQTCQIPKLSANSVLVRNRYVGINASDVNFTAGKYTPGAALPLEIGFEAVGEIVAAGDKCKDLIGTAVAHMSGGAFCEYQKLQSSRIFRIPEPKPEYLPLLVSGITAKLALEMKAQLKEGETVLVTAAAGGTGQFAVQLAKLAGCRVIGTCSTDKKVEFLKSIGCDRAINTSKEDLKLVLKDEFSKGVDVIYESIGGQTFDTCVNAMKLGGRLIVIGYISGYQDGTISSTSGRAAAALPIKLLMKSASVNGFFLMHYPQKWKSTFDELVEIHSKGEAKSFVDNGMNRTEGKLEGIESIPDAVDYMYSRKSIGKVFVDMFPDLTAKL
uniref:prostaglandin reductase-3-like n=1 Tax=Styela clava TaxID=7725 RepID=UPI001939BC1B|nr:prostaglandin reductase-3-like [Styela clava]